MSTAKFEHSQEKYRTQSSSLRRLGNSCMLRPLDQKAEAWRYIAYVIVRINPWYLRATTKAHPVARHMCARSSSVKADGVQEPAAMITSPASNTEPSVHWTPIVLPFWRIIPWTPLPGRTFPFRAMTSLNNKDNPWPALAQPPSRLKYPSCSLNVAVRTLGGNTERTWSPLCNRSTTAPKATSFLYDSLTYLSPLESEEAITSTPDLGDVGKPLVFFEAKNRHHMMPLGPWNVLMITVTPFFLVLPRNNRFSSEFGIDPIGVGASNNWLLPRWWTTS